MHYYMYFISIEKKKILFNKEFKNGGHVTFCHMVHVSNFTFIIKQISVDYNVSFYLRLQHYIYIY